MFAALQAHYPGVPWRLMKVEETGKRLSSIGWPHHGFDESQCSNKRPKSQLQNETVRLKDLKSMRTACSVK